jgi:hypothetical protein
MRDVLQRLAEETAKAASGPLWPMRDGDVTECLQFVHRWEQTIAGLKVRLAREADGRGIPAGAGHRSLAAWLRAELLMDPQPANGLAQMVTALQRRPVVEQALVDGEVDVRQAGVIAATVEAIPETLGAVDQGDRSASVMAEAEATLIDMAGRFPAYQVRRLGDRILAHVAPEVAVAADEAALRRDEARAHAKRHFTLSLPVDGVVRLSGVLDVESAAVVSAALQPLCTPIAGDDRTAGQRRADALADVCRLALRTSELPEHGGEPPQMTVTVPFDPVAGVLRAGGLDNGGRLSAVTVRRIACDARLLPVVLGTAGQVLDAGRTRRLANGSLRRALVARDRGCAFPDCDRPARWCDAHHLVGWAEGGPSNLDNLVLLCRHHHRWIHDPERGWVVRLGDDQLPEFIPPPWIDLDQRPRRNEYHPRI